MKTIRKNVFETNSSSLHSFVISRGWNWDAFENKNLVVKMKDFSYRKLIPHTNPEDKFAYLFMLLTKLIKLPISKGREIKDELEKKWRNKEIEYKEYDPSYTDNEISNLKANEDRLYYCFQVISDSIKEKCNTVLDFSNIGIYINKNYGYVNIIDKSIKEDDFIDTGCYGNDELIAHFRLDKIAININSYINFESDSFIFDEYDFYDVLSFAFDDNSIFIQDTDERDEDDEIKHGNLIKEYMEKNEYQASVIFPIGG